MTSSARETVLCRYQYDPLDRLISHALADTPGLRRFYCKSRLATEVQGAMRHSIVQQGDLLLAQQRSDGDAPDATLLATDQQRSVLQTLKANHPPQPISYSPYGNRPAENGLLSLLGFNGERPDPATGHYLLGNGYRTFNPVLMRFNSPDNWSPFGKGGVNSYTYCLGDPTNRRDPSGHSGLLPFVKAHISQGNTIDTFLKRPIQLMKKHNSTKPSFTADVADLRLKIGSLGAKANTTEHFNTFDKFIKITTFDNSFSLEQSAILTNPPNIPGHVPTLQNLSHNAVARLPNSLQQDPNLQIPKIRLSDELKNHVWEIAKQGDYDFDGTRSLIRNTYIEAANGRIRGIDPDRLTQQ